MNTKLLLGSIACIFFFACSQENQNFDKAAPSEISNESFNLESNNDSNRMVIKTAEIKLNVKNIEEDIQQFQQKVNALNGHVFHYEINNNRLLENEFQQSLDSSYQIYKIEPIGFMKVKVPVSQTDEFVNYVLSKNGVIEHFSLNEEDVTEDLQEKKELIGVEAETAEIKPTIASNKHEKNNKEEKIIRKTDFKKLDYKTNFIWFDISLNGESFIDKKIVASSKNYRTPFYVSTLNALDSGWYLFSQLLVGLLHLWPFVLLGLLVLIVIKKRKINFNKD
jgi:hypothetical protein